MNHFNYGLFYLIINNYYLFDLKKEEICRTRHLGSLIGACLIVERVLDFVDVFWYFDDLLEHWHSLSKTIERSAFDEQNVHVVNRWPEEIVDVGADENELEVGVRMNDR